MSKNIFTVRSLRPDQSGNPSARPFELARSRKPDERKERAAQEMGRKGGAARAEAMTPERRIEIARKAAAVLKIKVKLCGLLDTPDESFCRGPLTSLRESNMWNKMETQEWMEVAMDRDKSLPDVTHFVVKVPMRYAACHASLRESLIASFPTRSFSFELAKDASECIALVPVMEDSHGRVHLCRSPERSLVSHIYAIMNECVLGLKTIPA